MDSATPGPPTSALSSLIHRRQFLLADTPLHIHPEWAEVEVGRGRYHLRHHRELHVTTNDAYSVEVTAIGYLVDPTAPDLNTTGIVDALASGIESIDEACKATTRLGGRWVLVVSDDDRSVVFTDSCGFRQVFYGRPDLSPRILASQPQLIADELGLEPSKEAMEQFVAAQVRPDFEFWWPGDRTLFGDVRHLLPNHRLEFEAREVERFWPTAPTEPTGNRAALKQLSEILTGQILAVSNQFDLAHAITAGLDSRIILAASRGVAERIHYYTTVMYAMTEADDDVQVPARLLGGLGLNHHILTAAKSMSPEYADVYSKMNAPTHDCWGDVTEGMLEQYPSGRVTIHGTGGETGRYNYYLPKDRDEPVSVETLAKKSKLIDTPFVHEAFAEWLADANAASKVSAIPVLDLYHWEQRTGNWAASAHGELDIVHETFSPFNNRLYMSRMLTVSPSWRSKPRRRIFRLMIRRMWPETLAEPINPLPAWKRFKAATHRLLSRVGLGRLAARVKTRLTPGI